MQDTDFTEEDVIGEDTSAHPEEMLKAVDEYKKRGWVIHPLYGSKDPVKTPGKQPILKNWQELKETPADIERHIRKDRNIGLVCGKSSNVTVIDFDHDLFINDLTNGIDLNTLMDSRTRGRGHIYFKYTTMPSMKFADLGIEVLNDGSQVVLPPSIHISGDKYKWNNPDAPIIEMPEEFKARILDLFIQHDGLKTMLGRCRTCFRDVLKRKPNMHGADGRLYMIAVCTDLVSKGATEDDIKMFAKLMYGEDYDEAITLQELKGIDPTKTWQCNTLRATLPAYINLEQCAECEGKRARREDKKKAETPENKHESEEIHEQTPQHIIDKAKEVLEQGSPIPFLMKTYNNIHVGDEVTGKMLLGVIGCQSVRNSSGLQPKVSGASGKGKTHAVKTILHFVPRKYVQETTMSDKAIYHMDISPGTIIFSDDVDISAELQGIIKRATTNFQSKTKHTISVKDGGEWVAGTLSIPERIVWCLTSVEDNASLEFLNRQTNLGVDETPEQDKKVADFELEKAKRGEVDFPINDDVQICREIFKDIKGKLFKVIIPYADRIEWNNPENRRNLTQFLDFIKSFAVFDYRHRNKNDDTTIEANEDDFNLAVSLYSTRAVNQRFKLNDKELHVLKVMSKDTPYDFKQLQDATEIPYQTLYRVFHGRDGKSGLLSKVPGLSYQPETEYIGEVDTDITGEYEHTVMKKTKPRHIYVLNTDFKDLTQYSKVASLKGV